MYNILRPLPRKDRAAIGCTEKGLSIRMTVHWDLRSDELISYMQGMGCSKFRKNTIFNEHPVSKRYLIDTKNKMVARMHLLRLHINIYYKATL